MAKVLERPLAAATPANLEAARGTVYYGAGVDISRYASLLLELRLNARCLEPPELVDVKEPRIFLLDGRTLADPRLRRAVLDLHGDQSAIVVLSEGGTTPDLSEAGWLLEGEVSPAALGVALRNALRQIGLHERARKAQLDLDRRAAQMADLHHVGVALSAEQDIDALQDLILSKARAITSADAGSLYLVVEEDQPALDHDGQPLLDADGNQVMAPVKVLAFNKAQNFSNPSNFTAFRMPLNVGLAGYVVVTGAVIQHLDVYHLPPDAPYAFNRDFDQRTGYRSKSMIVVPMLNSDQQVVGVIQLINCKYRPDVRLTPANVEDEAIPFTLEDRDLLLSFASQAAFALDNRRLIEDIQRLFEGFVTAAVQAIESRDPTTSGHSERVAALTVGLAEAVNEVRVGELKDAHLSEQAIREVRYASLLHDFGKVGVREHVLVKAKKLYDWQMDIIRARFAAARAAVLAGSTLHGEEYRQALAELEAAYQLLRQANEPAVLAADADGSLEGLGGLTYPDFSGTKEPLVAPAELRKLHIRKGSLDEAERLEIESHVTHTYKFLTKIPWTHDLRRVPEIAWAHHEKLNGTGYPNRLSAEQIPLQSKMMAISDIFDALTAWDRPYKRAVPLDKALDILSWEARDGHIDPRLLDVFIQKEVFRVVARPA